MTLPRRRKRERMMPPKADAPISCRGHLQWVRSKFVCLLADKVRLDTGEPHACWGGIDAHHSKTRGAGGGDETVVPVCRGAHTLLDSPGWSQTLVEQRFGIEPMEVTAADLWKASPHGQRYRNEQRQGSGR